MSTDVYRFEGDLIEESNGGQGHESSHLMLYSKWVGKAEVYQVCESGSGLYKVEVVG